MSAKHAQRRDNTNSASMQLHEPLGRNSETYSLTDAISLLSASRPLAEIDSQRGRRCKGMNAVNEKLRLHTAMVNSFQGLVAQALKLLPADVRETSEFKLAGETVKLVKDDNGNLSAIVGNGNLATKVDLKMDADTFAKRLLGHVVTDKDTLGASAAKNILGMVYDRDLEGGLVASELVDMLARSSDAKHNPKVPDCIASVEEVIASIENAGNEEEKAAAISLFTTSFCSVNKTLLNLMEANESQVVTMRAYEEAGQIQPKTFASALMGILMDNFDSLSNTFEKDSVQLKKDVYFITSGELKAGWFSGEQARVNAIKEDAHKMPGEDSYQVDIGV